MTLYPDKLCGHPLKVGMVISATRLANVQRDLSGRLLIGTLLTNIVGRPNVRIGSEAEA